MPQAPKKIDLAPVFGIFLRHMNLQSHQTTAQSVQPARPLAPIGEACNAVEARLGELDNLIVQLSIRLEPLLTAEAPQVASGAQVGPAGSPLMSQHTAYLNTVADVVARLNHNVHGLLLRLEV